MNPTHQPGSSSESHPTGKQTAAFELAGAPSGNGRFRSLLRRVLGSAHTKDGFVLTDAGREALESTGTEVAEETPAAWVAVPGWCEMCGKALPWVKSWEEPLCPDCVVVLPADNEYGYVITAPAYPPKLVSSAPIDVSTRTDDDVASLVLRLAAQYLQRHGWIQGAYFDLSATTFSPAADLVGAIGAVCYGGPVEAPAQHFDDPGFLDFEAAVLHLDRYLLVEDGSEAYEFNDAKGRTAEDVIYVLQQAASRPADELIDALQAIDRHNADMAALAALVVPGGIFAEGKPSACPSCAGTDPDVAWEPDYEGDEPAWYGYDDAWHDTAHLGGAE